MAVQFTENFFSGPVIIGRNPLSDFLIGVTTDDSPVSDRRGARLAPLTTAGADSFAPARVAQPSPGERDTTGPAFTGGAFFNNRVYHAVNDNPESLETLAAIALAKSIAVLLHAEFVVAKQHPRFCLLMSSVFHRASNIARRNQSCRTETVSEFYRVERPTNLRGTWAP